MQQTIDLGIGTTFDYSVPLEPMCRMVARAGFKAITLGGGDVAHSGYDTDAGRQHIREIVAGCGIRVDSVHAQFGAACDISVPDERILDAGRMTPDAARLTHYAGCPTPDAERPTPGVVPDAATTISDVQSSPVVEPGSTPKSVPAAPRVVHKPAPARLDAVARVRNAIDAAQALDSRVVVLHLTAPFPPEEVRARIRAVRDSLEELLPYAHARNVKLAAENLRSLLSMQVFEAILEEFPELGVCYDSSHAHLSGRTFSVLQRFRERIITLHISDNRGQEDDHLLPFEGEIDWEEGAIYLARLAQLNIFMLEVEMRESAYKDSAEFLRQAVERARRLLELMPQRVAG